MIWDVCQQCKAPPSLAALLLDFPSNMIKDKMIQSTAPPLSLALLLLNVTLEYTPNLMQSEDPQDTAPPL